MSEQPAKFSALRSEQQRLETLHSSKGGDRLPGAPIAIGARFRMSALGAARSPRLAKKEGTIVGVSRINSSLRVLFDGSKSPISLHRDYVEQFIAEPE